MHSHYTVQTVAVLVGVVAVCLFVVASEAGPIEHIPGCRIVRTVCMKPNMQMCDKIVCEHGGMRTVTLNGVEINAARKRSKPTFMRLGKRSANFMRFGRASNFMRFGKRSGAILEPVYLERDYDDSDELY